MYKNSQNIQFTSGILTLRIILPVVLDFVQNSEFPEWGCPNVTQTAAHYT